MQSMEELQAIIAAQQARIEALTQKPSSATPKGFKEGDLVMFIHDNTLTKGTVVGAADVIQGWGIVAVNPGSVHKCRLSQLIAIPESWPATMALASVNFKNLEPHELSVIRLSLLDAKRPRSSSSGATRVQPATPIKPYRPPTGPPIGDIDTSLLL